MDDLGLANNTLILFYSDNGTDRRVSSRFRGEVIQGGKGETTQRGIRVPLIARWPGRIRPGTTSGDLIDATDFFPSLAELAGKEIPRAWGVEGHSFIPALLGQPHTPRDWCYFWYDPRPGWDKDKFTRSIFALDQRYKLFSDGRLFAIEGTGFQEQPVAVETLATKAAREKHQRVLDQMMRPPLSKAALTDPVEFGKP